MEAQSLERLAACRGRMHDAVKRDGTRGHNGGGDPGHAVRPERATAAGAQQTGAAIRLRSCAKAISGMRVAVDKSDLHSNRHGVHGLAKLEVGQKPMAGGYARCDMATNASSLLSGGTLAATAGRIRRPTRNPRTDAISMPAILPCFDRNAGLPPHLGPASHDVDVVRH